MKWLSNLLKQVTKRITTIKTLFRNSLSDEKFSSRWENYESHVPPQARRQSTWTLLMHYITCLSKNEPIRKRRSRNMYQAMRSFSMQSLSRDPPMHAYWACIHRYRSIIFSFERPIMLRDSRMFLTNLFDRGWRPFHIKLIQRWKVVSEEGQSLWTGVSILLFDVGVKRFPNVTAGRIQDLPGRRQHFCSSHQHYFPWKPEETWEFLLPHELKFNAVFMH